MHCWLTTHDPHYPDDDASWCIYVRRGFEHLVHEFKEGDRVAFYEVGNGPDRKGKLRKRPSGRKGVMCLATASGQPRESRFQETYADGTSTDFTLECACQGHVFGHCLRRDELFEVIGRKLNLRGLGGGAGLTALAPEEFSRLEVAFLESRAD
jgi:hypothetical protein